MGDDATPAGTEPLALPSEPDDYQPTGIRVHQAAAADGWRELTPPPATRLGAHIETGREVLFWVPRPWRSRRAVSRATR